MINYEEKFNEWKEWFGQYYDASFQMENARLESNSRIMLYKVYSDTLTHSFHAWVGRDSLYLDDVKDVPILTPKNGNEAEKCQSVLALMQNIEIEYRCPENGWIDHKKGAVINVDEEYRIKPLLPQLTLPDNIWELLQYDWLAMDEDKTWYFFEDKPFKGLATWHINEDTECVCASGIKLPFNNDAINWKQSLIQRPEHLK